MGEQVRTRARQRLGRQQLVGEKAETLDVEAAKDLGGCVGGRRLDGRGIFLAGDVGEVLEHGERGEVLQLELVAHMSSRISARRVPAQLFHRVQRARLHDRERRAWRSAISLSERPSKNAISRTSLCSAETPASARCTRCRRSCTAGLST